MIETFVLREKQSQTQESYHLIYSLEDHGFFYPSHLFHYIAAVLENDVELNATFESLYLEVGPKSHYQRAPICDTAP